ncbi:carboxypeptidase [Mycobacteroides abscessus]|nr:D-alanyl-D-alanine carboxypeptidase family protein [Mycobacteroides abscessus]AWG64762.1 carboxypeptidase [Mycobacteroides abscessus]RIS83600.1 carboxypeptidase [Mycobacteroides abscessus]
MTNLAIIRLNPRLLAALQAAARTAAAEGVQVEISSGWRSKRFQQLLLDEHAQTHKNPRTAAETVISPGLFKHVSGDAVDVPAATADWLASHGAEFGLCQVYAEEPWHFELLATAHGSCPTLRQGLVAAEDQGAH